MASLETKFVEGLFWKTLIIGAAAAAIGWWLVSVHFAGSILLGVLVSAFNMRVVGWVSRKMTRAATQGDTDTKRWSVLLGLKLFFLAVLTFIFIVFVGANVIAYVIGYSTFLAAIVWQLAEQIGQDQDLDGTQNAVADGDTESL